MICLLVLACARPAPADSSPPATASGNTPRDRWVGLAAARARHGVYALWTAEHVQLTRDGGAHFTEALAGAEPVDSVALGDDGTLFVVRGERRLGVLREGGAERWRALPFDAWPPQARRRVEAAGPWLVAIGRSGIGGSALASSRDQGRTWRVRTLPDGYELLAFTVDAAGGIQVKVDLGDCDWDTPKRLALRADHLRLEELSVIENAGFVWGVGAHGWSYGFADGNLTARRRGDSVTFELPQPIKSEGAFDVVDDGETSWALSEEPRWLLRFGDPALAVMSREVPEGVELEAADADGVFALRDGHPLRWTFGGGWRPLPAP